MGFTIDQLNRACGILLLTGSNAFIYCCKRCPNEFPAGADLETHILFEHCDDDDDEKSLESVFISEPIQVFSQTDDMGQSEHQTESNFIAFDDSRIHPDVKEFSNESKDSSKVETTRTSKLRAEVSKNRRTQQKLVHRTEKNSHRSNEQRNELPEFVGIDDISVKTERSQNQLLTISSPGASNEVQNEAMSMDEPGNSCSDCDDINSRESPALAKKLPVKKRNRQWKPQKGVFYCDMCPAVTFSRLENLKVHMKRHINNTIRKPCPLCSVVPRNMEKHIRIAHIEAKPYKCDFCDATFKHNIARVSAKDPSLTKTSEFFYFHMFF